MYCGGYVVKILTIIGNGFDLGHQLPTSFDEFIQSDPSVYPQKYATFRGGDGTWKMVEYLYGKQLCDILAERSWHDVAEVVEQIIGNYGLNEYGEVDYWGFSSDAFEDEFQAIQFRVDLLTEFEKDFQQYLRVRCGDDVLTKIATYKIIRELLVSSSRIISFNYTRTIETAYGVSNVDHIHGSVDTFIAIGSGTLDDAKESLVDAEYPTIDKFGKDKYGLQELAGYYDYDNEGNRYPKVFIERFFNEVAASTTEREDQVFNLLDAKNKDALTSRISMIATLGEEHYDRVYIIGHSLGEADYSVFDAINKDTEVVCFYYSEGEKENMENTLKSLRLRYKMVPNSELYR